MKLSKEQEEKLREEWVQHVGSDCGRIHTPEEENIVVADLANFWLSKINEALEAQRKEIVEAIKQQRKDEQDTMLDSAYRRFLYREILSLPQLTGKKNEDETTQN